MEKTESNQSCTGSRVNDETTTEYNTAELSDLSGLSKVLRADDSIADRVRCLLEDDDYEEKDKPELLNSAHSNIPSSEQIKERIENLLQDSDDDERPRSAVSEIPEIIETQEPVQESDPDSQDKSPEINPDAMPGDARLLDDKVEPKSPQISLNGRPSGDGADCDVVPPVISTDSADDFMNISDSTEYSDLPKVVDNPIKSASQPLTGGNGTQLPARDSSSVDNSLAKIHGKARYYVDSDPNTPQYPDVTTQIQDLGKYVQKRNQGKNSTGGSKDTPVNVHNGSSSGPIHSTPYIPAQKLRMSDPRDSFISSQPSNISKIEQSDERRRSQEANITLRSRGSNASTDIPNRVQSSPKVDQHEKDRSTAPNLSRRLDNPSTVTIPKELEYDEIIKKVRSTIGEASNALKGPHTSSEQSIASTVDSLALQVKNLLKTDERQTSRHSPTSNLSSVNVNEISHASNYSEEIHDFERTNLWKYARQFLPGAMTPSREIQPIGKFSEQSPIRAKEITSDSSNCTSPETYRMARRTCSPPSQRKSPSIRPHSSSLSKYDTHSSIPSQRDASATRSYAHSATPYQSYGSGKDTNSTMGKSPSRIIGRYDSYATKQTPGYTPQNESYKPLEPEYSLTPNTPYAFVTPRKVAWEPERESVSKRSSLNHRESSMNHRVSQTIPTRDTSLPREEPVGRSPATEEKSAYFGSKSVRDVEKSPKVQERSPTVRFQRLSPEHVDSMRRRYIPDKEHLSSTRTTNDDDIFVKPVTPPSRPRLNRSTARKTGDTIDLDPPSVVASKSSPRSVHFNKDVKSPVISSYVSTPHVRSAPTLPDYSFITPQVSARTPKRNITPKIVKERPRVAKSLPTFDQLLAEQEKKKEEELDTQEKSTPDKFEVTLDAAAKSTPVKKHDQEFSALQPEICMDESVRGVPRPSSNPSIHPPRDLRSSMSDTDLQRRTAHSQFSGSSDTDATSQKDPNSEVETDASPTEQGGMKNQASFTDTSPPSSPAEPAPLPFVRLCKTSKPTMPLRSKAPPKHSISTEKVQNLLMKEKSASRPQSRQHSQEPNASVPVSNPDYSSTDEDLLNLLETFSTKVPLMEKLLRKLYEKNMEKMQQSENFQDERQMEPTRKKIERFVQAALNKPKSPTMVRSVSDDFCEKQRRDRRKLFADTSSQTSFLKSQPKTKFVHKSTSPMEGYTSDDVDVETGDETEEIPSQDDTMENKENGYANEKVKSKQPCAFFVDLTPEKLPKSDAETDGKDKNVPVAWYEPYEYRPPWRPDPKPRTTLGFVDANIQEAFLNNKRDFVLRSWERQEDIALRAEERKLKDLEQQIHQQIEALHKEKVYNASKATRDTAPPVKFKGKNERVFGWKEMRIASKQKYESLPEVVAKKRDAERKKYYELNRKRAQVYKQKITESVVQKQRGKIASDVR